MVEIQRARLLDAMIEACREHGAGAVTVAHVVSRAGVSRRTFYELFPDREACFLAAFDEAIARASQRVGETYDPRARWRVRIRAALTALLELFDDEPAMGRLLVVESLAAGPAALQRRSQVLARLIAEVEAAGPEGRPSRAKVTALTGEGLIGAALSIVQARLSEEDPDSLPKLVNPLMAMIVLPYLGTAAAGEELAKPLAPRRPAPTRPPVEPLRELDLRLTYRTVMVLGAVAQHPGASNRRIGETAGISDQGQISKLLARLERLGLVRNDGVGQARGMPNAWTLTPKGEGLARATGQLAGAIQPAARVALVSPRQARPSGR